LVGVFAIGLITKTILPALESIELGNKERKHAIYGVDTKEKKVAISFDAAWGAEKTPQILDLMKKYNIKTTFFLVGFWVDKHPDMVKRIVAEGHEIGNHSSTHPDFRKIPKEKMIEELKITNDKIKALIGKDTTLFRPPFGEYNNNVIETSNSEGYQVIKWSVDSLDWKDLSPGQMYKRVAEDIEPGDIVLFHNNGKYTVEALPDIIEKIQKDGFKIVPISEVLYKDNYYIESHSGIMKKKPK
jgi:peptidoglycan-N-acetylglucosamine deacetylase